MGYHLKLPSLTYMAKENWKKIVIQLTCWYFPSHHIGRKTLTPHWIRWFNNIQANQHAKSFIQYFSTNKYLFSSTSTNPTLDLLPLLIGSMLLYMYWRDKVCHYVMPYNCSRYNDMQRISGGIFWCDDPIRWCTWLKN